MAVTYSCNGIVRDFPIPQGLEESSVTVIYPNGGKFTYSIRSFHISAGCLRLPYTPENGSTVIINDIGSESSDASIERIDAEVSQVHSEVAQVKAEIQAVTAVTDIRLES